MKRTTASVEETRDLAACLAPLTVAGDVVVLLGDLGAGKTAFVQGLAAALDSPDPVTSPTFTIAQRYDGGRLTIHHLDAFRYLFGDPERIIVSFRPDPSHDFPHGGPDA